MSPAIKLGKEWGKTIKRLEVRGSVTHQARGLTRYGLLDEATGNLMAKTSSTSKAASDRAEKINARRQAQLGATFPRIYVVTVTPH